jgi:purine-binding chemotaxis protein CheW
MSQNQETRAAADTTEGNAQYLTFTLGGEEYAVDILRVQEIKGYSTVTSIPNAPAYVKGVMNLRGTVVPVFDMRLKFGMEPRAYDRFTVIVVVNVGVRVVGLIVDSVSDVLDIPANAIEPTPDLGAGVDTRVMQGIARTNDRLVTLLDIDAVVELDGSATRALGEPVAA